MNGSLKCLFLVLSLILSGCVQPVAPDKTHPEPSPIVNTSAARQFEVYRGSIVSALRDAADLAESGATEQAVQKLIADRNAADRVSDLSPMMKPIEYPGDYSPSRTAEGLRAIASDLESGGK